MRCRLSALPVVIILSLAACSGGSSEGDSVDSTAQAVAPNADSLAQLAQAEAEAMLDSAKVTMASVLTNPASATFDSLVVVQPPSIEGRVPGMAVCGRIGGRPGIGGSRTPSRFIYRGKFTVFVEEAANREKFAELWDGACAADGGTVVVLE